MKTSTNPAVPHVPRKLSLLLVLVLLLSSMLVLPLQPVTNMARVHPQLLEVAATQPESTVKVIVQKQVRDASVETAVVRLGGKLTKDLSIINAFVAELPARELPALNTLTGIRWVSQDAPVVKEGNTSPINTANLMNSYIKTIGADKVWNESPNYYQGQNMTVAVIDSGINMGTQDLRTVTGSSRVVYQQKFNSNTTSQSDSYGHGTHVAGIIGSNGTGLTGTYIGVAPQVNLINLKVSDDNGYASTSDVVSALQWVYANQATYNIKVINLSLGSTVAQSYNVDPLDAAVEILWFNGVVVVVAGGNNGTTTPGIIYAPANDPFVISVGATDDKGTPSTSDDVVANYSTAGTTLDGFTKPDLVAPGTNIVSDLASSGAILAKQHPDHIMVGTSNNYFRMSGTSMASAVVAGSAALLLQSNPNLTPDQVKYRLIATSTKLSNMTGAGAGEINIYNAIHGTTTASANTGINASQLLWTGSQPLTWSSASWNSASWNSANWSSASWNSASWSSDYWGP